MTRLVLSEPLSALTDFLKKRFSCQEDQYKSDQSWETWNQAWLHQEGGGVKSLIGLVMDEPPPSIVDSSL